MSGVMLATGPCMRCGKLFTFNPHKVPVVTLDEGEKRPVCKECFDILQGIQKSMNLPVLNVDPDAWEPGPESRG